MKLHMTVKAEDFLRVALTDSDNIKEALEAERAYLIAKHANEPLSKMNAQASSEGSSVIVEEIPSKEQYKNGNARVIDLKPHFKASSKARKTEGGGWHLIVPMQRYTPSSHKSNRMVEEEYEMLKDIGMGQTVVDEYLLADRDWTSPSRRLNYQPPMKQNITKVPKRNKKREHIPGSAFIAFRTVSNKSDPSSWLINRQKADQDNFYKYADTISELIVNINDQLNQ